MIDEGKSEYVRHYFEAKKRVDDRRKVRLEEALKENYILFGGGRPVRNTVINQDDIINLLIDLHKTETVDEFIARM